MRERTVVLGAALLCVVGGIGCGSQAVVHSELPIKRVVVYRNGVAYFERAGHVEKDEVRFKMRPAEVGDFLATLAVMEAGGSSVRSAAFPLKDETGKPKDGKEGEPDTALRNVVLSLDGKAHDLQVGYIAAAPVWRPSYRLVVQPNGQSDLQVWGIVENLSGEDWSGVQLSLVAGAPIAFDARLGTPIIPDRPIVTDSGEVIVAVPKSETSLAEDRDSDGVPDAKDALEDKPAAAPAPEPAASATAGPMGNTGAAARDESGKKEDKEEAEAQKTRRMGPVPHRPGYVQPSTPRSVASLAAVAVQGGTTRYDIPNAITVPDKNATMVMLLARRIPGEAIYLFAPDDGVPDSASHPFHVVRFENVTGGVLERGPIAVFQGGSFLGQGLLDPLASSAFATVKFALERAIGVDSHDKTDVQGTRIHRIDNGYLWLEHDVVVKTTYALQNGSDLPVKLLVRHPRRSGARLYLPPPGTEDNVGTGSALFPTQLAAHAKQDLVVDERSAEAEYADWFGIPADKAVKAYLADPRADAKVAQPLSALWPLRGQIVAKQDQRAKLQGELSQLQSEAAQKRADLHAIEKNAAAAGLRRSLTARLGVISTREEALTAQNIQLGQDLSELQVRWREGIAAIHLAEAPPPKE
ncbi:MAG TPA: DUF4139 domain-containing protein [Polyangiaceae bacterium]|jgi:hypothetical protein|nr:DUF4139 domain-containing protein [Polyangiaceae bacterium]